MSLSPGSSHFNTRIVPSGVILSPPGTFCKYSYSMERIDPEPVQFSVWLRRQLDRRGWSGAEFARQADVLPATATRWINGDRQPRSGEHIRKIADALRIHQDEILELLEMRDGDADRMSFAVRRLAPVIDKYEWGEEQLEALAGIIDNAGKLYSGVFEIPKIEE